MAIAAPTHPTRLTKTQLHQISRALSDPTRFEIFQQIAAGQCIGCTDLREHLSVTAPTISHHLKELESAGLIDSAHVGKFVNLSLRREVWEAYLRELARI
jgi:ArsR family transcriptional regulator, arsenate/arsenite/antimonite-responsive transcriptional repressor